MIYSAHQKHKFICLDNGATYRPTTSKPSKAPAVAYTGSKFWVDDGCHSELDGRSIDYEGDFRPSNELHGVRCCSNDGRTCSTSFRCDSDTKLDHQQAKSYCAREGKRLCTRTEMESDMCCSTGGKCDTESVWTSTSASSAGKHWVDDGCHSELDGRSVDFVGDF